MAGADSEHDLEVVYRLQRVAVDLFVEFLRKIVHEAAAVGFLSVSNDERAIIHLSPRLFDDFDRFIAAGMSGHDLIYQLALQTVAPSASRSQPALKNAAAVGT